jgi:hypothetical protein
MPNNFRVSSLIPTGLIVDSVMQDGDAIVVTAHAGAQMAMCPLCCSPSQRVHSRYVRQVSDLPCSRAGCLHSSRGTARLLHQAARRTLSVVLRYVYMRKSFIRRQGGKNVAEVYTSWDNLDGGGSIMALDRMA